MLVWSDEFTLKIDAYSFKTTHGVTYMPGFTSRQQPRELHHLEGAPLPLRPPILVLGFGNTLLGDDGAGVHLLGHLRLALQHHTVQCIDGGTMSFSLLPYVEASGALLVTDAGELGSAAGTIGLFEGHAMDEFLKSRRRRTVHEVGITDLLDMARLAACLPQQRALLCIQPATIDWSEALSTPVAGAMPEATRQACAMVNRWAAA